MNEDAARVILESLLASYRRINELATEVFEEGSYPEALEFRKAAGHVMGNIVAEFLIPLFQQYPHLNPLGSDAVHMASPNVSEAKAREINAAVRDLASRLRFIEQQLHSVAPTELEARLLAGIPEVTESLELVERFAQRVINRAESESKRP
jgi:hypothetical protein